MKFAYFCPQDFQAVCDFLVELNREKKSHIHWNWARWDWMYHHPYCDRSMYGKIGLWWDQQKVVGAAIYDLYGGEAFCGALEGYRDLLEEIVTYACNDLADENGLGIAVRDGDRAFSRMLSNLGFSPARQTENMLCRSLDKLDIPVLPEGFSIRSILFPEEAEACQRVLWKGFDHEGDLEEWERMRRQGLSPHRNEELSLAVVDPEGEFAAHCTCWYDPRTDYAYIEPVCTVPAYRKMGLGKAVVLEALNRCRQLGAKEAFVLSDQLFYKKMGFYFHSHYTFYWKER